MSSPSCASPCTGLQADSNDGGVVEYHPSWAETFDRFAHDFRAALDDAAVTADGPEGHGRRAWPRTWALAPSIDGSDSVSRIARSRSVG